MIFVRIPKGIDDISAIPGSIDPESGGHVPRDVLSRMTSRGLSCRDGRVRYSRYAETPLPTEDYFHIVCTTLNIYWNFYEHINTQRHP